MRVVNGKKYNQLISFNSTILNFLPNNLEFNLDLTQVWSVAVEHSKGSVQSLQDQILGINGSDRG